MVTYGDAFRKRVNGHWGNTAGDMDAAQRSLMKTPALLLTGFLSALCQTLRPQPDSDPPKPCEDDGVFPSSNLGELLWIAGLEEGLDAYAILAKDDHHHAFVIGLRNPDRYVQSPFWAGKGFYCSKEDALRAEIASQLSWHAPRLAYAQEALRALDAGEDVSRFYEPHDFEEV